MKILIIIPTGETRAAKPGECTWQGTKDDPVYTWENGYDKSWLNIVERHEIEVPEGATDFAYRWYVGPNHCEVNIIPLPRSRKKVKKVGWILKAYVCESPPDSMYTKVEYETEEDA